MAPGTEFDTAANKLEDRPLLEVRVLQALPDLLAHSCLVEELARVTCDQRNHKIL